MHSLIRRFWLVAGLVGLCLCAGVAAPPVASGAVLRYQTVYDQYVQLWFRAAPGESNRVTMSVNAAGRVIVEDLGAPLHGCTRLTAHKARCGVPAFGDAHVVLGDRDDSLLINPGIVAEIFSPIVSAGRGDDAVLLLGPGSVAGGRGNDRLVNREGGGSYLWGGRGDDVLRGGDSFDSLSGGPGDDLLRGGSGPAPDTAGPWDGPVAVDLALGLAVEPSGVDTLLDIEDIEGSPLSDTLKGNARDNFIFGGGGNDVLRGRGGPDDLYADLGDDILFARDGVQDRVDGGLGTDLARVDPGLDQVIFVETFFDLNGLGMNGSSR